jgi:hypothetical protein
MALTTQAVLNNLIYTCQKKVVPVQYDGVAAVYRGGKWVTTGRKQRLVSYDVHNFFKK